MNSGNDIIDLTLNDSPRVATTTDNNRQRQQQQAPPPSHSNSRTPLAVVGKRVRSFTCANSSKKVKAEKFGASAIKNDENNNNDAELDGDDDEIKILDAGQVSSLIVCTPDTIAVTGANGGIDEDDDAIQVVGTVGHVRLPHLRQDCTESIFKVSDAVAAGNSECCDLCYCYVCDKPASECSQWTVVMGKGSHCNATNATVYWQNQRKLYKENPNHPAALGAPAAEDDDDDDDAAAALANAREMPTAVLRANQASATAFSPQMRGEGPFAPDKANAQQDATLTQRRNCHGLTTAAIDMKQQSVLSFLTYQKSEGNRFSNSAFVNEFKT